MAQARTHFTYCTVLYSTPLLSIYLEELLEARHKDSFGAEQNKTAQRRGATSFLKQYDVTSTHSLICTPLQVRGSDCSQATGRLLLRVLSEGRQSHQGTAADTCAWKHAEESPSHGMFYQSSSTFCIYSATYTTHSWTI
jgi:hypothetical protein